MCDTLVAVGPATGDGSVILAKNSDRQPNEAQALTYVPRAQHEPGAKVRCTYIEVPQVPETYEALLCRPFWMWGAEMGVNEYGVAIGNEAVFTREPYGREPGLIGMDLLRLALERADTARAALDTLVGLLETYGQSGNCGYRQRLYYHNSYLIADPGEAWVLETAGKQWAAERVTGVRTISNGLTIGAAPDLASAGQEGLDFARRYGDPFMTRMDGCRVRQARSTRLLAERAGRITVQAMMAVLRDHGEGADEDPAWDPGRGWLMDKVCVHAGLGPTRPSQSVGSMVAHLVPGRRPVVWVTGTSAPCTGIFKPAFLGGVGLPPLGPEPAGRYDPQSLWWSHERLHRAVIRDYGPRLGLYREQRDALEADFCREVRGAGRAADREWLADLTRRCFRRAAEATADWTERVLAASPRRRPPRPFALAWDRFDRQAALPSA